MIFATKASIFFLLFLLSSDLFCQKAFNDRRPYELIKSENFTKPVKFWVFSKGYEKTGLAIVAVQEKQIKWMNDVESGTFDLPQGYLNTVFSKSGNYFGILRLIESPKSNVRNKILKLEIYTSSGEKLYSLSRNQYADDTIPAVVISNSDGSVIMGQNTIGKIWFYSQNGGLNREVELFSDTAYDLERILYLDLSEEGKSLAIAASKQGASQLGSQAPHPSGEPYLFLLNHSGDHLWSRALPEFNTSAAAISRKGDYMVANSYTVDIRGNVKKMTSLFNNNGETIASFDLYFKFAHFSPDSQFLILAENSKAEVVELSTGQTVWSHNISRQQGMVTAVSIANEGGVVALLVAKNEFKNGAFVFTNSRLKVFNRLGELHQEMIIKDEIFKKAALRLSPDAQQITVGFEKSYRIYEANK